MNEEVMTIPAAAAYLQISMDTLYKYAADGKVPGFKLGNRWRFTRSTLDVWMNDQAWKNEERLRQVERTHAHPLREKDPQ